ncbi:transcription antitermination factor NusB [Alicyclobacillus pomorum]|jgi:N utilization substance protein B|uniref:transcription antitermination factor NusB n=1 Tax=Alicyclobacillus pomorum TaxID=204470 RepID=UPI0004265A2D|nr:transcription antitermination factor NusB [Alicyclobacillus pomorum]
MRRRELRQKALQSLYQIDVGKSDADAAIRHVLEEAESMSDKDVQYVQKLVHGTTSHLAELDELLASSVQGWKLDRIASVDRNVLRLAVYELLYETDVDIATIVDEAVELAKAFSTEESGRFVNGVLAKILPTVRQNRQ